MAYSVSQKTKSGGPIFYKHPHLVFVAHFSCIWQHCEVNIFGPPLTGLTGHAIGKIGSTAADFLVDTNTSKFTDCVDDVYICVYDDTNDADVDVDEDEHDDDDNNDKDDDDEDYKAEE